MMNGQQIRIQSLENTLLKELKVMNKCVIAITHDNHYFHHADRIIKMNMGKMEVHNIQYKVIT